jgi:hypothetical protein
MAYEHDPYEVDTRTKEQFEKDQKESDKNSGKK